MHALSAEAVKGKEGAGLKVCQPSFVFGNYCVTHARFLEVVDRAHAENVDLQWARIQGRRPLIARPFSCLNTWQTCTDLA